jgi:predicted amidohydrolase
MEPTMGTKLIVAAGQMGPAADDKMKNLDTVLDLVDQAGAAGAAVISMPELCLTKYFGHWNTREFAALFDEVPGPMTAPVQARAARHRITVILPLAERAGITLYNTAVVIGPDGEVRGCYRKMHLPGSFPLKEKGAFTDERLYFTPGDLGFPVFDVAGIRIGIQICHDRNFPEGYRILALAGAELVFTPTNMPVLGSVWQSDIWETTLRLRAYENAFFSVGIGKAGVEDGLPYVGDSVLISPLGGTVLTRAKTDGNELVLAEIDLGDVQEARTRMPFPRDRRPEHYGALTTGRP